VVVAVVVSAAAAGWAVAQVAAWVVAAPALAEAPDSVRVLRQGSRRHRSRRG